MFPVNIAKYLRAPILKNICEWLLLFLFCNNNLYIFDVKLICYLQSQKISQVSYFLSHNASSSHLDDLAVYFYLCSSQTAATTALFLFSIYMTHL